MGNTKNYSNHKKKASLEMSQSKETAILAGGCFWGMQDLIRRYPGVVSTRVGYTGGEVLLRKRLSPQRFEKIHASFERHEFWALMFPAMLPPPTPFKIVVLAAAAFEMNFGHFLLAIFAGRFLRFLIEAVLTLYFGPGIVTLTGSLFAHHFLWILSGAGAALLGWLGWRRIRRQRLLEQRRAPDHSLGDR